MGFCYESRVSRTGRSTTRLCCDVCGTAGARKFRCPFGYCPATAGCPACKKARPDVFGKEAHRALGCEAKHATFMAEEQAKAAAIAAGKLIRTSAVCVADGRVKVCFRGRPLTFQGSYPLTFEEKTFLMAPEVYSAPLGPLATPEDYARLGTLTPIVSWDDETPVEGVKHEKV